MHATAFYKQAECPSSQTLLSYRTQALTVEQVLWVEAHLGECDFCGAELQLFVEHPPAEEEDCKLSEIPTNLRCLAESLLGMRGANIESFAPPAYEKERLTLTDA
ncbi:MAG TPA: hypothetical protein VF723_14620 [Pyrinomonadaceae bacterium]